VSSLLLLSILVLLSLFSDVNYCFLQSSVSYGEFAKNLTCIKVGGLFLRYCLFRCLCYFLMIPFVVSEIEKQTLLCFFEYVS
jgi:hypothetical protein